MSQNISYQPIAYASGTSSLPLPLSNMVANVNDQSLSTRIRIDARKIFYIIESTLPVCRLDFTCRQLLLIHQHFELAALAQLHAKLSVTP